MTKSTSIFWSFKSFSLLVGEGQSGLPLLSQAKWGNTARHPNAPESYQIIYTKKYYVILLPSYRHNPSSFLPALWEKGRVVGNCIILLPSYQRCLHFCSRLRTLPYAPLRCRPLHWAFSTRSRHLTRDHYLTILPWRPTLTTARPPIVLTSGFHVVSAHCNHHRHIATTNPNPLIHLSVSEFSSRTATHNTRWFFFLLPRHKRVIHHMPEFSIGKIEMQKL